MHVIKQFTHSLGAMTLTADLKVRAFNSLCPEILKISMDSAEDTPWTELLHFSRDSIIKSTLLFSKLLDGKLKSENMVLDFISRESIHYIEIFAIVQKDEEEEPCIELSFFDVTKRERSCPHRNKIDLKSQYLSQLGNTGTIEMLVNIESLDMTFYLDNSAQELMGVKTGIMKFHEFLQLVPSNQHYMFMNALASIKAGSDNFCCTHQIQHIDKGMVWIEAHGTILDRSKNTVHSFVAIKDITKEKSQKDSLLQQQYKLEKVSHLMHVGFFEVNLQTGEVIWDKACYAIHGYSEDFEITYEHFVKKIVYPEDLEKNLAIFNEKIKTPKSFNLEYRCIAEDGSLHWVRESIESIKDEYDTVVAIRGAVTDVTDEKIREQELQTYRKRMEELVTHDELTKIYNRRMFNERFEHEWRRAIRSKQPLSIAIADIDHFKEYNDLYGHVAGDMCLSKVAEVLANSISRSTDIVARYGGEEFAFILPDTQNPTLLLECCRQTIEEIGMSHKGSENKILTISIGCATKVPTKELKKCDLLQAADEELYRAKSAGRNQVCYKQM